MRTAVVLFNLGGPDSLDAVQPFLENLFNDPDIFKLPFQKKLAKYVSVKRAPKVQEEYKLIGGKSPIAEWTEIQRSKLEQKLRETGRHFDLFTAMRYWHPLTEEAAQKVLTGNYDRVLMLPLYPHYSISTTGSSFNEWKKKFRGPAEDIIYVNDYYDNHVYLQAVNQRIDESLFSFPSEVQSQVQLVFSAHGTPLSYLKKGDPYNEQIKASVAGIMKLRNYDLPHHICYQSKVGPARWLEPSTDKMIEELAAEGKKHLLIIPISFVSDHIETLFELDIEYRHVADNSGIENYIVMTGLNESDKFVQALYEITLSSI